MVSAIPSPTIGAFRAVARCGRATRLLAALAMLAAMTAGAIPAGAQQAGGSPSSSMVLPGKQGSSTSTLELPAMPGAQGGASMNVPPPASQQQELVIPSRELREQPGYEQVTVTVIGPSGTYVTGLRKDDFKLYLDGREQPIQFFRQDTNTPVSIGILVDTSGSMQPKIQQARFAIAQFLNDLNSRDDVFLFAFSNHPFLLQPFTMNHELVMRRLGLLRAYGQTALFDTILQGLRMVQHGRWDKKALLVVTDGMDNTSGESVAEVVKQAREMGVLVYSIGIGDPNATGSGVSVAIGPLVIGGDNIDQVDAATLRKLSTETGARTYIIRQVGDGVALRNACAQISLELREQYTIGFLAPDPGAGGYRSVRVDVPGKPTSLVRVRKGVEVGGARTYASDPGGTP
jgi:Ca-activated chloride channel family protein